MQRFIPEINKAIVFSPQGNKEFVHKELKNYQYKKNDFVMAGDVNRYAFETEYACVSLITKGTDTDAIEAFLKDVAEHYTGFYSSSPTETEFTYSGD